METEAVLTTIVRTDTGKEIKVKIPVNYHIKLHTLKVLKGLSISDTVEMALAKYFRDRPFPDLPTLAAQSYPQP